eukprot:TRINITY_DN133_c0_g1_i7.p1 TRINITY_DN133_c0_g1~~TRINITY_DN133_c0_g1_i7.p1  ORF type:complete len:188 (+),score=53.54 TRINITY_DN133_c0_g1_i7:134-697(+)
MIVLNPPFLVVASGMDNMFRHLLSVFLLKPQPGGCKWMFRDASSGCVSAQATTCLELLNPTTCADSLLGCEWDPETLKCIDNTTSICFDSKTPDECAQSTVSGGCKWSTSTSSCISAQATTCPELFNPTTCSYSQLNCKWNPVVQPHNMLWETLKCIDTATPICFEAWIINCLQMEPGNTQMVANGY